MDSNVNLFGELCSNFSISDQSKLWEVLRKYQVKALCGFESFESCFNKFISAKLCEGLSNASIANYTIAISEFRKYIKDVAPANITTNDIRDYIIFMKEIKLLKKTSIQQNMAIIRTFFNWMYNENIILSNPMNRVKSLKPDKSAIRHPLTNEELEAIRSICSTLRERAMIEFFVNTGCRLAEVTNLTKDKIDFENNCATVTGKGNKTRTVFFDIKTKEILREYLGTTNCDYIFTQDKDKTKPLSAAGIEALIKGLGERAHLTHSIYPHILRHTFATNALAAGMDITTIQKLLGHEDLSTTQIYAELNMNKVKEEYNKYF